MNRFENAKKIGVRDWISNDLLAVYPYEIQGSEEEIEKKVKDWFYQQSCSAESQLETSFVDIVKPEEQSHQPSNCGPF